MHPKQILGRISTNPLVRMDGLIQPYLDKASKAKLNKVNPKYQAFLKLKHEHYVIGSFRVLTWVLLSASILSILTQGLPFLDYVASQAVLVSSFVGIPVLTILAFLFERARVAILTDAEFLIHEILIELS